MARRILILGGARFHGLELAQFFNANGDEVHVLNRGIYRSQYQQGVKHLIADRNNYQQLKSAVEDFYYDIIIDNNAYNQHQVEMLLDLIQRRCGHYIFTSTAAVYLTIFSAGESKEEEAKGIQSKLCSPQIKEYAMNKFAAENTLRKNYNGMNFTILRFPNIFGEGDFKGKLAYFYYRLKDEGGILLEKQINRFNIIYVKDAVRVFYAVAGNGECFDKTLNVCEPKSYNYDEFFKTVYKEIYSQDKLVLIDAQKLWKDGFHPPFAWGPMIDATLARKLLKNIAFTPLIEWSRCALEWEIEHFKDMYQRTDYVRARKFELELIEKYCHYD